MKNKRQFIDLMWMRKKNKINCNTREINKKTKFFFWLRKINALKEDLTLPTHHVYRIQEQEKKIYQDHRRRLFSINF